MKSMPKGKMWSLVSVKSMPYSKVPGKAVQKGILNNYTN